jgi:hypothetical protein
VDEMRRIWLQKAFEKKPSVTMAVMKQVALTTLLFALVGYVVLACVDWLPFSAPVLRVLCPAIILNYTPVDPDWTAILGVFAPINAVLYALVGAIVGSVRAALKSDD